LEPNPPSFTVGKTIEAENFKRFCCLVRMLLAHIAIKLAAMELPHNQPMTLTLTCSECRLAWGLS
jgi:hypothetical protein